MRFRVAALIALAATTALVAGCLLSRWGSRPQASDADRDGSDGGDADHDSDGDSEPGACEPLVLYTFYGVEDPVAAVRDASEVDPDVPLLASARDPLGLEPDGMAVAFSGGRLEASEEDSSELGEALLRARSFTAEVWARTDDSTQTGPARILTYSTDLSSRAFTLGQSGADFVARVRTTATGANAVYTVDGRDLSLATPAFPSPVEATQLVLVFDGRLAEAQAYVNGELRQTKTHENPDGARASLSWDTERARLALGDEVGELSRPWSGTVERVAIYPCALSADEIYRRYLERR